MIKEKLKEKSSFPNILVDSDTVSNTSYTNKRVCCTFGKCNSWNALTDILTIDNLLSKLNSKDAAIVYCIH